MAPPTGSPSPRAFGRWRAAAWGMGTALLLLPLVAMRFTDEVNWGAADFALAAGLLIGFGLLCEGAVHRSASMSYRAGAILALGTALLLVWANLAVGLIGDESNPANRLVVLVPAIGAIGTLAARARPAGMAATLLTMAGVQGLVAVVAMVAGLGSAHGATLFFTLLWLASAALFRRAARGR